MRAHAADHVPCALLDAAYSSAGALLRVLSVALVGTGKTQPRVAASVWETRARVLSIQIYGCVAWQRGARLHSGWLSAWGLAAKGLLSCAGVLQGMVVILVTHTLS